MIAQDSLFDERRLQAFRAAILHYVKPGMRVLEIGGKRGDLSSIASQAGAAVGCVVESAEAARNTETFLHEKGCVNVEVVIADPASWAPESPVDIVLCDTLEPLLLCSRQISLISAFKRNYEEKFGGEEIPVILPEATLLAVQAVQYQFDSARTPVSSDPYSADASIIELSNPIVYSTFQYRDPLPLDFSWSGNLALVREGTLTGLRFITKNVLAILIEANTAVDWHNEYITIPVTVDVVVKSEEIVRVTFRHEAGGSLEDLAATIEVSR